jgi:hypothetical protein
MLPAGDQDHGTTEAEVNRAHAKEPTMPPRDPNDDDESDDENENHDEPAVIREPDEGE